MCRESYYRTMKSSTAKSFLAVPLPALALVLVTLAQGASASSSPIASLLMQSRNQQGALGRPQGVVVFDVDQPFSSEKGKSLTDPSKEGKETAVKPNGNARFLGVLLNPYNPYNPFSRLLVPSSSATSDFTNFIITSRIPQAASATLINSAGDTNVGNVHFLQKSAASPVIVVLSGQNAALTATTTGLLEVRTNPVPSTGTDRCSDGNLGPIFNPTNAVDGGVITRTATVTAAAALRLMKVYVQDLQPTRASLFATNSIIGRSVRYSNANGDLVCGTVVAA